MMLPINYLNMFISSYNNSI